MLRSHSMIDITVSELGAGTGGEGGDWAQTAEPQGYPEAAEAFSLPESVVYHIRSPLASTRRKIS